MKILVIGGTGVIGRAVVEELSARHEIIVAAYQNSDIKIDISSTESVYSLYEKVGFLDAIVVAAGSVHFGLMGEMTLENYLVGINNKLLGQIDVVLQGVHYLNDLGSITLIGGILNQDPIIYGSSAAMVNGALEGFVRSAALELPRGIRINLISPTVVTEAMSEYGNYFRGFESVPAKRVALAYSKSVEGAQTGHVYKVGY